MNTRFRPGSNAHRNNQITVIFRPDSLFSKVNIMRTKPLLSSLAVCLGLLGTGAALVPAWAQQNPAPVVAADKTPLTIPQVHNKLSAEGYRQIEKIETERNRFEVYATDRDGQRVELYVDRYTGQVLRSESKGDKRDKYGPTER